MKKFLLVITILFLATACNGSLKQLNLKSLETKLDNKETFVLYLTDLKDEGKTLEKTLVKVSKESDIEFFYLNTDKLNTNDKDKLKTYFTYDDTNFIAFVKEGKEATVLSRVTDAFISEKKLKEELKTQGYLK